MADVAVVILRVVAEIHEIAKGIKESDRQASRLSERVAAVEPAVFAIKSGRRVVSSSESLRQLSAAVEDIRNFLSAYAGTSKLNRAMNRKSNAAKFTRLGALLTEGMQALQLNVSVEEWAKEDASDRLEDLENFIDMLESMERQRNRNHAEIMGVLKTLRKDERSELTESFEINAEKDLDFENSTQLGKGGFGEVRTAKWKGVDVAVKQLLRGRLDRNDIRALRKEVRIHSDLRFAHVVQLYAACTIAPNLCLVIEFASGGSLRQYLHSAREPLSHPLQVAFLYDIARGMSFLHGRGIFHRDLKSANVLMFDNGRLKLCDFGLSKVKTESSKTTRGVTGTVPWMAPELLRKSPADEQTDVYSFGIVSFEVATRAEPYKGMDAPQVIMAVVVDNERPHIPEGASASPDVVPLMEKCWKQDPADRPEGFEPVVQALADVVRRVGDPRVGGPAPRTVNGGVDASSSWSNPSSQAAGVDTGPSPGKSQASAFAEAGSGREGIALEGGTARRAAEDAVVSGVRSMHAPFADPPVVSEGLPPSSGASSGIVKQLGKMFGQMLSMKDKNENKEGLHKAPVAVRGTMSHSDDLKVAKELVNRAGRLRKQGNYAEAAPLYPRAVEIQEKMLGPGHQDVATTLNNWALLLNAQGEYAEAMSLNERATEIWMKALGPEHPTVATVLNNRAGLLESQGKYEEAEPLYERAQAIREKVLGPEHPDVAQSLNNRAELLRAQGKYAEAEPLYERSQAIREKGKYAEAEPLYERCQAIKEKVLGPEHPSLATTLNNRALLLSAQGKYDEAGPLYERSLAIREKGKYSEAEPLYVRAIAIGEKALGPEHPDLAVWLNNRALLLKAQGKYDEAGPLYERSLAIREKVLGPEHPDVAQSLNNRALLLKKQEKYTDAIPLLERALSIRMKKLGESHPDTVSSQNSLEIARQKV